MDTHGYLDPESEQHADAHANGVAHHHTFEHINLRDGSYLGHGHRHDDVQPITDSRPDSDEHAANCAAECNGIEHKRADGYRVTDRTPDRHSPRA
jgi:hypothetical protein